MARNFCGFLFLRIGHFFLFRGNRGALFRGNRNGLLVALFIPGGAPHNDLYGETPRERGTFFFLFRGN